MPERPPYRLSAIRRLAMRSDLLWRTFAVLCILLSVAVCVGVGFGAWHFIAKFW